MKLKFIIPALVLVLMAACNSVNNNDNADIHIDNKKPTFIDYSLISVYPHDTTAYTEGFLMHEGKLYESTGYTDDLPQTNSLFGEVDLKTGKINTKVQLDTSKYFGEGIVFLHDKWYQLTYKTKVGFVYAAKTFKQLSTFVLPVKEGWGMTTDSTSLIMSEGSDIITYADPVRFIATKKIAVTDESGPVNRLNELEYINGFIYANIYGTPYIVKIDPARGKVIGKLDLSSLVDEQKNKFPGAKEMNGIAYNPANNKIYVSGKMWPNIYEIAFNH